MPATSVDTIQVCTLSKGHTMYAINVNRGKNDTLLKDWEPQKPYPNSQQHKPIHGSIPTPLGVSSKKHLYRRLTLTLQWRQTNPVMFTTPRIGTLLFSQNLSSHLTSDTATPWGKTEMLFKNPSKCIVNSGKFLSTVSVIKQFNMENYSMSTVRTADTFLWEQMETMRVKKLKLEVMAKKWLEPILPELIEG